MNPATTPESVEERCERLINGIKNEAQGYRDDHMKCVNWLCDNGQGNSIGNPTDEVIARLNTTKDALNNLMKRIYHATYTGSWNEVNEAMKDATTYLEEFEKSREKAIEHE
jgi:hypothetical protein